MSTNVPPIAISPHEGLRKAITEYAEEKDLDLPDAVEALVTEAFLYRHRGRYLSDEARVQAESEEMLFKETDKILVGINKLNDWDEHVTKHVFESIKEHHGDIHRDAIGKDGKHARRIHARIGRRTKRKLGAEVVLIGGKRGLGQPSRTEGALIKTYTLLRRPNAA
jgi:hypothetical protein